MDEKRWCATCYICQSRFLFKKERNEWGTHMVMRDIVEEETTGPAEKRSVDSGYGTADKGPLFLTVVRDARVGVVEVREHDNPVV